MLSVDSEGLLAESELTPARVLLAKVVRFAQRLYVRPRDGGGPEEIFLQEGAAITTRLKAVAGTKRRETVEPQVWSEGRSFPGRVFIYERGPALETIRVWRSRDTIWTDGSCFDSGEVEAACAWKEGGSLTGRRFHLGKNKEVFDAETFALCQALKIFDRRQESGR